MPFIVSVACAVGAIQKNDCFAQHWLRKENGGAVITWMSTMDQPWTPPMRGQDYFYDILIGGFAYDQGQYGIPTNEQRTHWGAIAVNAANLMLSENSSSYDKATVRTWTTFGDPSLQLRTKLPATIASSANTILQGFPYTTTITANGVPVSDALVCISQNGEYFHAFTDANGNVSIANSFTQGNVRLVVTAFNTTTIYEMIECTFGGTPQFCEKPVNLSGHVNGATAMITWSKPINVDGSLLGYNVYRNNLKIGETSSSVTQYNDPNLVLGTYTYEVSARYQHCEESELTAGIDLVVTPQFCEKPVNLVGINDETDAVITWGNPANIDGVLLGYKVYRDGGEIGETEATETEYRDKNLANGTYVYKVSAKYEHCEESILTDGASVVIFVPQLCEKPENPSTIPDETDYHIAIISWDEPQNIDGILLGYNIYREGKLNENVITENEYRDAVYLVGNGTVYYGISAVYEHCESELTELVKFVVNDINNYQETSFNIFPNPTNGNITIESAELNRVEIYDVLGQKLVEYVNIFETLKINVNNYDNGIYFVKMYSENNVTVVKRLVVIK
jgi:hypothetical protein